jgi:hypothetical protein
MSAILKAALAGLLIGSALSGLTTCLFLVTRSYRRTLNRFVVHSMQFVFLGTVVGSILLLGKICDRLHIEPHSDAWSAALFAFLIPFASGVILIIRAEIKWRKSAGLWRTGRPARSGISQIAEQPGQFILTIVLCSFFGGFGTAILLPSRALRVPRVLAWYGTLSSIAGAIFTGYVLRKAFRRGRGGTTQSPPQS